MSDTKQSNEQLISRVAKRKKKDLDLDSPGEKRQPGSTSTDLRRLMSDPLADIFSEVGVDLYEKSVKAIQDNLTEIFGGGVKSLGDVVKQKLGEYGYDESQEHFRQWMKDIVADVVDSGMSEIVGSLESMITSLSSTYTSEETAEPEVGEEGGEGLLGMEIPEVPEEEVEEVKEEELPAKEETPKAETPTPLKEETPAATATPAPTGGMPAGAPEAKASVDGRTYRVLPELQQIYAASKKRFKLQRIARERVAAVQESIAEENKTEK